jgi:chemotaxis protein CheX
MVGLGATIALPRPPAAIAERRGGAARTPRLQPRFDSKGSGFYTWCVRQEILAAFVEAVRQVFRDTDIAIDSVDDADAFGPDAQVIASLGLTGDVKGIFMLRTDLQGAAGILKAMTGGIRLRITHDRLSEIQLAAIGEISNQIAGRAITLLSDLDLRCDITPPAVLAAPQLQSLVPDLSEIFRQTVRGPFGRLTIFLGIQRLERPDPLQKTS